MTKTELLKSNAKIVKFRNGELRIIYFDDVDYYIEYYDIEIYLDDDFDEYLNCIKISLSSDFDIVAVYELGEPIYIRS